jgi:hypothetical protein
MLKLQVTSIEFDFDCGGEQSIPRGHQENLTQNTIGKVYEVEDEDYLADAISDETGWCVNSIEYVSV